VLVPCATPWVACCRQKVLDQLPPILDRRAAARGGADIRPDSLGRSAAQEAGAARSHEHSHASTRLVHGVQLPVSHADGGERKRLTRSDGPWMCGNRRQTRCRPPPVTDQRLPAGECCKGRGIGAQDARPEPDCRDILMRRSAASSAGASRLRARPRPHGAARALASRRQHSAIGGPPPVSSTIRAASSGRRLHTATSCAGRGARSGVQRLDGDGAHARGPGRRRRWHGWAAHTQQVRSPISGCACSGEARAHHYMPKRNRLARRCCAVLTQHTNVERS